MFLFNVGKERKGRVNEGKNEGMMDGKEGKIGKDEGRKEIKQE